MTGKLIQNIIKQVVCWILLLQIFNISINPPDLKQQKFGSIADKEDLLINKIESVYELVVEGVSDEEIPETDEDEIDTTSQFFVLFFSPRTYSKLPALGLYIEPFSLYYNNFPSITTDPHFPPPRFA